jgi:hypothetical protein
LQGGNERKVVVKILQGEAAGAGTGPLLTWHQIKHEAGRYQSKIEREGDRSLYSWHHFKYEAIVYCRMRKGTNRCAFLLKVFVQHIR